MSDVYVKVFRQGGHILVAACDAELLGKTLKDGDVVFEVREGFYGGSLVCVDKAMGLVREATCANLVGSTIVDSAVREGLVHPQSVIRVSGVPHVQIVRM